MSSIGDKIIELHNKDIAKIKNDKITVDDIERGQNLLVEFYTEYEKIEQKAHKGKAKGVYKQQLKELEKAMPLANKLEDLYEDILVRRGLKTEEELPIVPLPAESMASSSAGNVPELKFVKPRPKKGIILQPPQEEGLPESEIEEEPEGIPVRRSEIGQTSEEKKPIVAPPQESIVTQPSSFFTPFAPLARAIVSILKPESAIVSKNPNISKEQQHAIDLREMFQQLPKYPKAEITPPTYNPVRHETEILEPTVYDFNTQTDLETKTGTATQTQPQPTDVKYIDMKYIQNLIKNDPSMHNKLMSAFLDELVKGNITKAQYEKIKKDIQYNSVSEKPFVYKTYDFAPVVQKQEMKQTDIYSLIPESSTIKIKNIK